MCNAQMPVKNNDHGKCQQAAQFSHEIKIDAKSRAQDGDFQRLHTIRIGKGATKHATCNECGKETEHWDAGKDCSQIEALILEGTGGKDKHDFKQRKPGNGRDLPNKMKTRVARSFGICCMSSVKVNRQCCQSLQPAKNGQQITGNGLI